MKTFYFDTGVRPYDHTPPVKVKQGQVLRGTIQIPFDCEGVPEGYTFCFACDNKDVPNSEHLFVAEIHNSVLASKYAFFKP